MAVQTQAYLDEMKTPAGKTLADARNDLLLYIPEVGQLQEQLARWGRMAEVAMIAEPDPGNVEFMRQGLAFQHDLIARINQLRDLTKRIVDSGKQMKTIDTDMREWISTNPDYTGDAYNV